VQRGRHAVAEIRADRKDQRFALMELHEPVKKLIKFYAARLGDAPAARIVDSEVVRDQWDAQHLLRFCDRMFDLAIKLHEDHELVFDEPVQLYDVEKSCIVLHGLVSSSGFDYLIEA
jgi:hypothetical protein